MKKLSAMGRSELLALIARLQRDLAQEEEQHALTSQERMKWKTRAEQVEAELAEYRNEID